MYVIAVLSCSGMLLASGSEDMYVIAVLSCSGMLLASGSKDMYVIAVLSCSGMLLVSGSEDMSLLCCLVFHRGSTQRFSPRRLRSHLKRYCVILHPLPLPPTLLCLSVCLSFSVYMCVYVCVCVCVCVCVFVCVFIFVCLWYSVIGTKQCTSRYNDVNQTYIIDNFLTKQSLRVTRPD